MGNPAEETFCPPESNSSATRTPIAATDSACRFRCKMQASFPLASTIPWSTNHP